MTDAPGESPLCTHASTPLRAPTSTGTSRATPPSTANTAIPAPAGAPLSSRRGIGNTALTGTLTTSSSASVTMRTPTRKPSPSARHCSGGLVMSISTRTRCSSTPSAETLVNAAGSTRRTRPSSGPSPPQRSIRTGAAGLGLQRVGREQLGDDLERADVAELERSACRARPRSRSTAATRSTLPGDRRAHRRSARAEPVRLAALRSARRAPARPRGRRRGAPRARRRAPSAPRARAGGRSRAWSPRRSPARASCSLRLHFVGRLQHGDLGALDARVDALDLRLGDLDAQLLLAQGALVEHRREHRRQGRDDGVRPRPGRPRAGRRARAAPASGAETT